MLGIAHALVGEGNAGENAEKRTELMKRITRELMGMDDLDAKFPEGTSETASK
jgi:hypothetical protein